MRIVAFFDRCRHPHFNSPFSNKCTKSISEFVYAKFTLSWKCNPLSPPTPTPPHLVFVIFLISGVLSKVRVFSTTGNESLKGSWTHTHTGSFRSVWPSVPFINTLPPPNSKIIYRKYIITNDNLVASHSSEVASPYPWRRSGVFLPPSAWSKTRFRVPCPFQNEVGLARLERWGWSGRSAY